MKTPLTYLKMHVCIEVESFFHLSVSLIEFDSPEL